MHICWKKKLIISSSSPIQYTTHSTDWLNIYKVFFLLQNTSRRTPILITAERHILYTQIIAYCCAASASRVTCIFTFLFVVVSYNEVGIHDDVSSKSQPYFCVLERLLLLLCFTTLMLLLLLMCNIFSLVYVLNKSLL